MADLVPGGLGRAGPGDDGRDRRRSDGSIRAAEQAGLVFAFRARCLAVVVVAVVVMAALPWPRDVYYLSFALGFLVSGYVPFRFRTHPRAEAIKFAFVICDVVLLTGAVLNLPSGSGLSGDWPIQTRLRNQNFLYLLLLLGEAALTYAPRRVVWTGASIVAVWTSGFLYLYTRADSLRFVDIAPFALPDDAILRSLLDPLYVSLAQWQTQVAATVILTVLLAVAVHRARSHLLAQVHAEVVQSDLSRYVSPDIAQALTFRGAAELGAPVTRRVAVLFADIVGFTALAEGRTPDETFVFLREFQELSSRQVFAQGGMLDKYLGDGFMATFGALRDEDDAARRAVDCALELREAIDRWCRTLAGSGFEQARIAVGIHFGSVVVGNVGSDDRLEFTVVGDVVNVASRLEKATREFGCRIAVSEACVASSGRASSFGRSVSMRLRGREAPVVVHLHDGYDSLP